MLFANFENDSYSLQCHKYACHSEILKLLTISVDKMNVSLYYGTKYFGVNTKYCHCKQCLNSIAYLRIFFH